MRSAIRTLTLPAPKETGWHLPVGAAPTTGVGARDLAERRRMTHLHLKPRSSRTASPGTRVGWLLMPLLTMLSCVPLPRPPHVRHPRTASGAASRVAASRNVTSAYSGSGDGCACTAVRVGRRRHASQHPGGSAGPRAVKATWVARALASNTVRSLLCSRGTPLPTCAWFTTRRGEHAATSGWRIQLVQRVPREHTASRHRRHEVVTTCWRPGRASSALPRKTRVEMPLMACGCAACRRSTVKTPSVMGNAMVMVVLSSVIHVAVRSAHPNRPLS